MDQGKIRKKSRVSEVGHFKQSGLVCGLSLLSLSFSLRCSWPHNCLKLPVCTSTIRNGTADMMNDLFRLFSTASTLGDPSGEIMGLNLSSRSEGIFSNLGLNKKAMALQSSDQRLCGRPPVTLVKYNMDRRSLSTLVPPAVGEPGLRCIDL